VVEEWYQSEREPGPSSGPWDSAGRGNDARSRSVSGEEDPGPVAYRRAGRLSLRRRRSTRRSGSPANGRESCPASRPERESVRDAPFVLPTSCSREGEDSWVRAWHSRPMTGAWSSSGCFSRPGPQARPRGTEGSGREIAAPGPVLEGTG